MENEEKSKEVTLKIVIDRIGFFLITLRSFVDSKNSEIIHATARNLQLDISTVKLYKKTFVRISFVE